jgi:hypothetical protein
MWMRKKAGAAALVLASGLLTVGCGDDAGGSGVVQERSDGSKHIGDAGLAPEEQAGGAGDERGKTG